MDGTDELAALQDASFAAATTATRESYPEERRLSGVELASYLDRRSFGVLCTTRRDGRPHAALVSFVRRGSTFWMPTVEGSVRARNVAAQPWGTLVVTEGDGGEHVAVLAEGPVERVALTEAPGDLARVGEEWVALWLRLDARRILSYAAEGAVER